MTDKPEPEPDHDDRDGCLCGLNHSEHETTADHDLPVATGGVEARKPKRKPTRTALGENA